MENIKQAEAGTSIGLPSPMWGSTESVAIDTLEKEAFQFSNALTLVQCQQF